MSEMFNLNLKELEEIKFYIDIAIEKYVLSKQNQFIEQTKILMLQQNHLEQLINTVDNKLNCFNLKLKDSLKIMKNNQKIFCKIDYIKENSLNDLMQKQKILIKSQNILLNILDELLNVDNFVPSKIKVTKNKIENFLKMQKEINNDINFITDRNINNFIFNNKLAKFEQEPIIKLLKKNIENLKTEEMKLLKNNKQKIANLFNESFIESKNSSFLIK